jgi:predicted nucleic acid-binding protein
VTYFFDTSALVKRYHPEVGSSKVEAIFREHNRRIVMSRLTVVELQSAFALKIRTGQMNERSSVHCVFAPSMMLGLVPSPSSQSKICITPLQHDSSSSTGA